ncbi:hypothetical protein L596_006997 [Steinernema carpocapsae]|uniref:BHLH domain-containing protein n=1 Tax=Steinernema carpocapsae TaxID=34508 RepID=A0A4U5P7W8_STECR|nr:hypothetical protein L596_006997 [Steinernema carpocapsae]
MRSSTSSQDSMSDENRKVRRRGLKAHRSADIERRRNLDINSALEKLQSIIPIVKNQEKLSKIKRLRVAIRYIEYLATLLKKDENCGPPAYQDFQSIVMQELQTRNSYVERAEEERVQEEFFFGSSACPPEERPRRPSAPSATFPAPSALRTLSGSPMRMFPACSPSFDSSWIKGTPIGFRMRSRLEVFREIRVCHSYAIKIEYFALRSNEI